MQEAGRDTFGSEISGREGRKVTEKNKLVQHVLQSNLGWYKRVYRMGIGQKEILSEKE